MDPAAEDHAQQTEFVAAADYETGVIPLARPGIVVWLGDHAPDADEVARAAAMRAHPASGADRGPAGHLRAVS